MNKRDILLCWFFTLLVFVTAGFIAMFFNKVIGIEISKTGLMVIMYSHAILAYMFCRDILAMLKSEEGIK